MTKICSSPTIPGLEKLINQYYYSTNWKIDTEKMQAYNSKLGEHSGKVKKKGKKYIYFI